jgi:molybdate transport system substrate-binding protein
VPSPELADAATDYPVAVTADSGQPDLAQEFVDLVRSDEGRRILDEAGFEPGEDEDRP